MFKFSIPESIQLDVNINVPNASKHARREHGFTIEAKYLSHTDKVALRERIPAWGNEGDDLLAKELVQDWSGLQDEEGKPIEFSEEKLMQLMDLPWVRTALLKTLVEYVWNKNFADLAAKNL